MREDTIAAIATPMGEGGIGIIRISGEDSQEILGRIFSGAKNEKGMYYGHIKNGDEVIDEVIVLVFKAPHSYTTEDVVEIQCHGGIVSLRKILNLCLENGARMAEPGEFTKRAFLNGRLDLTQAEAVIDLIKAKTDKTFEVASMQLEGKFSKKIKEIRKKLVDVLVNVTVNIDYPDEDIEVMTYENLIRDLNEINEDIESMLSTSSTGKIMRDGLRVSIIGKPNVGKSSLMNTLLKETRAIVTSIPGTTRDTIEEEISIKGIPVILTDTAGIRETTDEIEKIGIEKSKEAFNNSDLVIFMLDSSRDLDEEDMEIMEKIGNRKTLCLINKIDLDRKIKESEIREKLPNAIVIETSMEEEKGLQEIEDEIENIVYSGKSTNQERLFVTNVRHENLLKNAKSSINDAIEGATIRQALEFLEIDINSAYESLGLIIGEEIEDDIINEVFKRFCLGK